jgi:outer membrane protein assembly factor BamB
MKVMESVVKGCCAFVMLFLLACAVAEKSLAQSVHDKNDWSEFRGRDGRGITSASGIPQTWTAEQIAWQTPLRGRGWSSPVIADQQIWLTTAIEHKSGERITRIELMAQAVDRETGSLVYEIPLFELDNPPALHLRNSYASPTPVIDGDRVFCSFGAMGLAAIDRQTGEVLWKNESLKIDHETGPGSSPIVWNGRVYLNYDGTDRQFVAAFDAGTGEVVWTTTRSGELHEVGMYQKAFSTPLIWHSPTGPQLISAGANWVYSYNPEDGHELWKVGYDRLGFSNVPRPMIRGERLYVCTGFMQSMLQAYELPTAERAEPRRVWQVERGGPTIPSPILVDDYIVMVSDEGILSCIDTESGEVYWSERLRGAFAASPILIEGAVWLCNDRGRVYLLKPGRTFDLVATNDVGDQIMATPAAVDNDLIIRTKSGILCIRGSR